MKDGVISNKRYFHEHIAPKFEFLKHITSFFYYVLFLIVLGFLFFGYALVTQHFTTPYGGDFSQQGLTFVYNFYDTWWTFFKTGEFPNFVHNVFLGNDNIQAMAFYGLFSPFTFPMLFFPRDFLPQAQALMSIARLVVGGLLFRVYLKYLGCKEGTARIFSIAYAFTGWVAYFLWFNSFYEVLTFIPLIFFGIEKIIKEKQIWAISLGFFLLGISNYFFILTAGIFGVFYAGFRFFQTIKERNLVDNFKVVGLGVLGFAFGCLSSMVIVFPAIISSFGIERSTSALYFTLLKNSIKERDWSQFFKLFFYAWNPSVANNGSNPSNYYFAQYFPLASFFYPTVSDRYTNIVHYIYFENSATSIFLYTPCIIFFFASIYRSFKNKKISHFIAIAVLSICLFVPFFYFLCGAFSNIYGRWEIVISISALAYIALNFDHRDEMPKFVIALSGLISFIIMLILYFVSLSISNEYTNISSPNDIIGIVIYQLIITVVETFLFTGFWKSKHIGKVVTICLSVEVVAIGTFVSCFHGLQSYETSVNGGYNTLRIEQNVVDQIKAKDDSFYRIENIRAKDGNPNITLTLGYNGVSTFHSFYNNNVDEFQRFSMILKGDTSWSGGAFSKRSNLDEFLGVKYYISKDSETAYNFTRSDGSKYQIVYEPNIPLGYERIDENEENDGYRVYKNKYQIDFATSFVDLYYMNECAGSTGNTFYPNYSVDVLRNEETYFKGVILHNDDLNEVLKNNSESFTAHNSTPTREATRIYYKNVKIYTNPNGYSFNPNEPDRDIVEENLVNESENTNVNKYQMVYESSSGEYFPTSEEGSCFYFDYPVRNGSTSPNYDAAIFLIGEDENGNSKVITYDECRYNARNDGKTIRALYSKEKVKRIIICPTGGLYRKNPALYYEPFEKCITRYENAIENGVQNVTLGVDRFEFDTSYEENRFVVTQVAYTEGWKIKSISESGEVKEIDTYLSDGGFVGFVANKGNYHYVMTYVTPHSTTGLIMTIIGFVGTISFTLASVIIDKKKKIAKNVEASN